MSLYGSEGSFEQQIAPPHGTAYAAHHAVWSGKPGTSVTDLTELLSCRGMARADAGTVARARAGGLGAEAFTTASPVHPLHLLQVERRERHGLGVGIDFGSVWHRSFSFEQEEAEKAEREGGS